MCLAVLTLGLNVLGSLALGYHVIYGAIALWHVATLAFLEGD